jgi:hypothetical protein
MDDITERAAAPDAGWLEDERLCYTVVGTPDGFLAVVLAVAEGQLVYDAQRLFPTVPEAVGDLQQRVVAGGGRVTELRFVTPQVLFARLMTLLVYRERASAGMLRIE